MSFKQEFLAALGAGQQCDTLLDLVHRYESQGLGPKEAYNQLQQIWLEFGFDKEEAKSGSVQNDLEAVMEKIWYECPA